MKNIKKVFEWIVFSSADPERFSLTLKGIIGGAVTVLTVVMNLAGIGGTGELGQVTDALIGAIQAMAATVTAVMTVYGLFRKIYLTAKGDNQVLNS